MMLFAFLFLQVRPVALLPGAPLQALARPPRGAGAAGAGRLPIGEPLLEVLLPGRVGPGGHDGDHAADKGGEGDFVLFFFGKSGYHCSRVIVPSRSRRG